jgi:hypothetical protein
MCHTFVSPYKPDACSSIGGLYRPLRLLPAPPEFDPTAAGLAVLVFSGTPASLPANLSSEAKTIGYGLACFLSGSLSLSDLLLAPISRVDALQPVPHLFHALGVLRVDFHAFQ